MIVVGIENVNQDTRYRDFTPTHAEGFHDEDIPTSGGADNFLNFLKKELAPFIDKNYRTEPFRIIIGTSMGGLFTSYALINTRSSLWLPSRVPVNQLGAEEGVRP